MKDSNMLSNSIHSVSNIRKCEEFTMNECNISSLELMESAGTACANRIASIINEMSVNDVFVFCGPGNNGGDGAVIASQLIYLHNLSCNVTVVHCAENASKISEQNSANISRWREISENHTNAHFFSYADFNVSSIKENDLIIDAIFGIGVNKQLTGIYSDVVRCINSTRTAVIAIDMPSGLYVDEHTPDSNAVVNADITLTIQFYKLGLLLQENFCYFGSVELVGVGILEPDDIFNSGTQRLITKNIFEQHWDRYYPFAHKGTNGHGLLIAGSKKMPGAAILASGAALRSGIGKLTVHSTNNTLSHLINHYPEAILDYDVNEDYVTCIDWNKCPVNISAVAIGPGMGTSLKSYSLLKDILNNVNFPIVIDADALNLLAEDKTKLAFLPKYSILTPHIGEFDRIAGIPANDFDRVKRAREFAVKYTVIVILKGHHTIISMPDGMQYFNTSGNPALATAGSGDVLTGLLLSLLAQGYNPEFAAILGAFVHGLAADIYVQNHHYKTLIASDIPNYFSDAFSCISK